MELSGAQMIIGILEREGIRTVSGIPGGANLPLYDALAGSGIRHVLARHEQAAGFIAQGMARRTGEAAVCFATSGPGVTKPPDGDRGRQARFGARGGHHRAGGPGADRHRRIPGDRHYGLSLPSPSTAC
jgi:hypothetical protein